MEVMVHSGVPGRTGECFIYVTYIIKREGSAYGDVGVGWKNWVAREVARTRRAGILDK